MNQKLCRLAQGLKVSVVVIDGEIQGVSRKATTNHQISTAGETQDSDSAARDCLL